MKVFWKKVINLFYFDFGFELAKLLEIGVQSLISTPNFHSFLSAMSLPPHF